MKKSKLPKTDSIEALAEFWDTHDVTGFEDELDEVVQPVFARGGIRVSLETREVEAVEKLAQSKGVSREELIRSWIVEHLARRRTSRSVKRRASAT